MISRHFNSILSDVPKYHRFLKIKEIEEVLETFKKHSVVDEKIIGKTAENKPLKMFTLGSGQKTALIIGVPHSDEPLGSLVTTYFITWMLNHPEVNFFGWRWLIISILEQRGMRLNEGWFSNHGSLIQTAKSYFREPTENQYEWTFPFEYKNYKWLHPRPESKAVREVLKNEKPDLLCNLHHCGFYNTYFYFSKKLPKAYSELRKLSNILGMPLSTSNPDVPFGKVFSPGFYQMYGLKDYVDYYKKYEPEKLLTMKRGASSDEWYQDKIGGFSFNCEVPILKSLIKIDNNLTDFNIRDLLKQRKQKRNNIIQYCIEFLTEIEPSFSFSDPLILNSVLKHVANAKIALEFSDLTIQSSENRKATNFEFYENDLMVDVEDLLLIGQLWRIADSIRHNQTKLVAEKLVSRLDKKLITLNKKIIQRGGFIPLSLQKLIRMQLGSILIIADVLSTSS